LTRDRDAPLVESRRAISRDLLQFRRIIGAEYRNPFEIVTHHSIREANHADGRAAMVW
jgi:hypothetical protein